MEAIATRLEVIATRLEVIAVRLEAIALRLEAIALRWRPSLLSRFTGAWLLLLGAPDLECFREPFFGVLPTWLH